MINFGNGMLHAPPVVKNLIIVNALVFLAQTMLPDGLGNLLTHKLALYFWESDYFQPYQLVTHMFLHGSFSHLFFNMFSLWMFGRYLEYDMGSKRFLTFYVVTGIGAAILYSLANWAEIGYYRHLIGNPAVANAYLAPLINVPTLGASGAVYGVLLAYGMIHPNEVLVLLFPPIPMKAKYFVIIFMVIELAMGFAVSDNVAHFAHVGGMIWAFLLLRYWKAKGKIYY